MWACFGVSGTQKLTLHTVQSPIYQLALTFAAMQLSVKAYHDPTGLVESLQLKKGDQQDASEWVGVDGGGHAGGNSQYLLPVQRFSKLFMSLIGDELEKGDDEALKTVIDDEASGSCRSSAAIGS